MPCHDSDDCAAEPRAHRIRAKPERATHAKCFMYGLSIRSRVQSLNRDILRFFMALSNRTLALLMVGMLVASGCGGGGSNPGGPTPPAPTLTSISVSGLGSPLVRDTTQLTAVATFSDGSTQTVTAQVTW